MAQRTRTAAAVSNAEDGSHPTPTKNSCQVINDAYQHADAFLFGRRTYEIFAGYWRKMKDARDNPITVALNTKPKYVTSNTLKDPQWTNTIVLSGDAVAAVEKLKAEQNGELQVHGSGALIRSLLGKDLIDEMTLLTCPIVIGQGKRLFPEVGPDIAQT